MRKRYIGLALAVTVLLAGSIGYVSAGARLYQQYQTAYGNYQFAASGSCDTLIAWSPPKIVYSALYSNEPGLVTLRYRSPKPQALRISVGIPHFTQDQSIQIQAAPGFQQTVFKPPLLDADQVAAFIGPDRRAAQIHLRVQTASGTACDTTTPVMLMSHIWMHWDAVALNDSAKYLAGWVTPHVPAIAALVGRATQELHDQPALYPDTDALYGYNEGRATPQDVRNEVNALYDTLESVYHVRYAQDNLVYSQDQQIRLPGDVLAGPAPVGMCLETTAILASAVEYLGMRPYIVVVPGHAYLGVGMGPSSASPIEYWETSDLNAGADGSQANVHGDGEHSSDSQQGRVLAVVDVLTAREQGIAAIE